MVDTTPNEASTEGFLLLNLPNCTISTPSSPPQTGILALQCVTVNTSSESPENRDVWLIIKLNSFEMVISPTQTINYSRSISTYMFLPEDPNGEPVKLFIPMDPSNPVSAEDLETMEVLLSQYGVLHDQDAVSLAHKGETTSVKLGESGDSKPPLSPYAMGPPDYKGRLVLMDEDNGEIMGALDENIPIKEDAALGLKGHEKDPVVVDIPEEELDGRIEAYVHPPTPEERDLILKTAGLISRGIMFATSAIAIGMSSASKFYISHSTPTSKPVEFSPRTRDNVKRIHNISGKAVQVTARTTGTIFKTLDYIATKVTGSSPGPSTSNSPPPPPPRSNNYDKAPAASQGTPPPLPPRKPRLLNRLLASTDLLLSTVDHSAKKLLESGTQAISASLTHKYGEEMGEMSRIAGKSVQNVGLVYIDIRGVGRRALLKRAGKVVVKARMGGKEVVLGQQAQAVLQSGASSSSPTPTFQATSKK